MLIRATIPIHYTYMTYASIDMYIAQYTRGGDRDALSRAKRLRDSDSHLVVIFKHIASISRRLKIEKPLEIAGAKPQYPCGNACDAAVQRMVVITNRRNK